MWRDIFRGDGMSTIDITIVADPVAIIRDNPVTSPSTPVALKNYGKGYVFGVTNWNDVNFGTYSPYYTYNDGQDNNEGGFALDIKAEIGDTIRWRMVSLTGGFEYQCFIQSFKFTSGVAVISSLGHKTETVSCAVQGADGTVTAQQIQDYYWETTVAAKGSAGYNILISIFDSQANHIGIFTSDPYIEVPGQSRYALG
jgi:hypothetical protein